MRGATSYAGDLWLQHRLGRLLGPRRAVDAAMDRPQHSPLQVARHIRYWRRNLLTFLPHHYTSNDSNRMALAFFTLAALDLLGDLPAALSPEARSGHVEWVYHCQLPSGGFRASPGTDFGALRSDENAVWDPANVPATFFALLTLRLLGDGLDRVRRRDCLAWLKSMQRSDGSFGETLGEQGRLEGGSDTRFAYMAMATRWMLRGNTEGVVEGAPDVDLDALVHCIRRAEVSLPNAC